MQELIPNHLFIHLAFSQVPARDFLKRRNLAKTALVYNRPGLWSPLGYPIGPQMGKILQPSASLLLRLLFLHLIPGSILLMKATDGRKGEGVRRQARC